MSPGRHDMAAAYALDALDDAERIEFERHHDSCAQCRAEVAAFRESAALLAGVEETPPPESLKASVLLEVIRTPQEPADPRGGDLEGAELVEDESILESAPVVSLDEARRSRRRPALLVAAAAALVLLLVGATALLTRDNSVSVDEVATAPDAVARDLEGAEGNTAELAITWSPDRDQVAVVASDLPELSSDEKYALWFLFPDGVQPAGLFSSEAGVVETVLDVADRDPIGWGVTVEPTSGSDQPTTPVIYSATF